MNHKSRNRYDYGFYFRTKDFVYCRFTVCTLNRSGSVAAFPPCDFFSSMVLPFRSPLEFCLFRQAWVGIVLAVINCRKIVAETPKVRIQKYRCCCFVETFRCRRHFGLDRAADLIYDKAEGCCPEKWGGGGCPEEEI